MDPFRFSRIVPPLAALAAALPALAQPATGTQEPPLYRVEVVVFAYHDSDPAAEHFAHIGLRRSASAAGGDAEIATFDFGPYLPVEQDADAFRSRELLGGEERERERAAADGDGRDVPAAAGAPPADAPVSGPAGAAAGAENALPNPGAGDAAARAGAAPADGLPTDADPATGDSAAAGTVAEAVPPDPFGPAPGNAVAPFRFRLLAPDELELAGARSRLDRLDAYTPLVHGGWIQEGLPLGSAPAFDLAYLGTTNPAGSVRLHLSRYLHLTVDLVYRPSTGNAHGASSGDPLAESPAGTAPGDGRDAAAGGGAQALPGAGDRGGFGIPPATRGEPSGFGAVLSDVDVPPRYLLRAERRIVSGTVQYFDHPMFGVLVLVKPYEPPATSVLESPGPAA